MLAISQVATCLHLFQTTFPGSVPQVYTKAAACAKRLAIDCSSIIGLPAPSVIGEKDLSKIEKGDITIIFWIERGLCIIEMLPPKTMPCVIYVGCSLGWRRVWNRVPRKHVLEDFARLVGIPTDMGTPDTWTEDQKNEVAMRFLGSNPEMNLLDI